MAELVWDQPEDRIYETGLDHGVLYLEDNSGVPWNGLISVDDDWSEFQSRPFFFDGKKFVDYSSTGDYGAKIKAITYPDEFNEYDGYLELEDGLHVGDQNRKSFGLSYRTLIGDGVSGLDLGYKIHILYNLTAKPQIVSHKTLDSDIDPIEFSWAVTSRSLRIEGYSPTSHVIVDSRYIDSGMLNQLEGILYGTESTNPELPSLEILFTLTGGSMGSIVIVDHGDGTWSAFGPDDLITMLDSETFQITEANATYLDADTYNVSSS